MTQVSMRWWQPLISQKSIPQKLELEWYTWFRVAFRSWKHPCNRQSCNLYLLRLPRKMQISGSKHHVLLHGLVHFQKLLLQKRENCLNNDALSLLDCPIWCRSSSSCVAKKTRMSMRMPASWWILEKSLLTLQGFAPRHHEGQSPERWWDALSLEHKEHLPSTHRGLFGTIWTTEWLNLCGH